MGSDDTCHVREDVHAHKYAKLYRLITSHDLNYKAYAIASMLTRLVERGLADGYDLSILVSYTKMNDRGAMMLSSPAIMMFLFTGDARALSRYQAVVSEL